MRHDRPTLRGRYAAVDARLRTPGATRTLATLVTGLLVVQGAVVLDRSTDRTAPVAVAAPATAAGEDRADAPAPADATDADLTASGAAPAVAAPPAAAPSADDRSSDASGASSRSSSTAAVTGSSPAATGGGTASSGQDPASAPAAATPAGAASAASTPAQERFASLFPAQSAARQSASQPATTRWAVLIGVNEHQGRTRDNVGSRQDAEELAKHLRSLGWRDDHIVLLTDGTATRENIIEALRWLQRKSNGDSVVVVHYSGHVKQWHGRDADGDGEITDEAFWPSDNRFITDREVGDLLGRIRSQRLWFNVGGCEAAGFNDWGITGPDRIVTWSSAEHQKSYEDPRRGNSIWGWYLIDQGLLAGLADANGDGNITVEEAFRYATPRADQRTRGQSHGRQTPAVSDRYQGEFDLRIPPPPRPRSSGPSSDEDDGTNSCLLCPGRGDAPALRRR